VWWAVKIRDFGVELGITMSFSSSTGSRLSRTSRISGTSKFFVLNYTILSYPIMSSTLSNKNTKLNRTLSKKVRYRGITKLQLHQRNRQRIAQQKASEEQSEVRGKPRSTKYKVWTSDA